MHHGRDDEWMKAFREQIDNGDEKRLSAQLESMYLEHKTLGATGRHPEGKLTPKDDGEIAFAVYEKEGKVVLDFGDKPVSWVGMSPEQASEVGRLLMKRAKKARRAQFLGRDDG